MQNSANTSTRGTKVCDPRPRPNEWLEFLSLGGNLFFNEIPTIVYV